MIIKLTNPVNGLKTGMKLESLDIKNPVNYCVATIVDIVSHRICLRYDGFGQDSSYDFWLNFQAEEIFPIGWCAMNNYHLQPPTGKCSLQLFLYFTDIYSLKPNQLY